MRLPVWRWTLTHQILALVAVSIMAAQLAGLVVFMLLPQRPPAPMPLDQAVERIREAIKLVETHPRAEGVRELRIASDRRLSFTVTDNPPATLHDPFADRFAIVMSRRLGLEPSAVRMVALGSSRALGAFPRRPMDDFGPGGFGGPGGPGLGPGPGPGPDGPGFGPNPGPGPPPPPASSAAPLEPPGPPADLRPFRGGWRPGGMANFPRGRRGLAVQVGTRWLLVRTPFSASDALWVREAVLSFALTLAALLAPALWIASRTARRIRAFAEGAERFGRNPDTPLLVEEGPDELRQAIGAFNRMQSRIQRLVSDRTMMMAAVSHDLRTPLARVRFRIAELDPAARDAIASDIQQMDELIGQMLTFTRDALPNAERKKFDLSALIQSLVDDLADSGSDVSFEGPDKLTVEANLPAVRRVIGNLLDNALKFAGHARVTLKPCGDMVATIVADDGPGVPADMQEAIFEPFRRLEPSRNRKTGGVGLGLAIARNLARGHGGDIALEPGDQAGARFVFTLPLR
jgi:two-component system OmpR family sensor kinase